MNPLHLTLVGFKGIKAGLGVDEIEIPLTMPGNLIAITGPNGAGKTTILDNLHPYRVMPSRASSYSPGSFSYYDNTYGNAKKLLSWEHAGEKYLTSIVINGMRKQPTQECYLMRVVDGELEPVTLPDRTMSDGKTITYDRCVEHILGTPEMFFTAAFSCQGRKTLADYANADIKNILSDLLGLDDIRELSVQSNEVTKAARERQAAIRSRADQAATVAADIADNENAIDGKKYLLVTLTEQLTAANDRAGKANQRLIEAKSAHANYAETDRRRATLRTQLDAIKDREASAIDKLNADGAARLKSLKDDHESRVTQAKELQATAERIEQRTSEDRALLEQADAIKEAGEKLESATEAAERAHEDAARGEDQATARAAQVDRIKTADTEIREIDTRGKAMAENLESLKKRAALTRSVPCNGMPMQRQCQLLSDANNAAETIPTLETELQELRGKRAESVEQHDVMLRDLGETESPDLPALRAECKRLDQTVLELTTLAGKRGEIEAATRRIESALKELAETKTRIDKLASEVELAAAAVSAFESEQSSSIAALHDSYSIEKKAVQGEIEALPPTDRNALEAAEREAVDAETALASVTDEISAMKSGIAAAEARIESLKETQASLSKDVDRVTKLDAEIAHWSLLSKALGNDGIIALSIDDAGPTLTALCNDLLTACYGPRFSVSIVTQEETKAGTTKEVFDIIVYDAERGDGKSFTAVSGGERVWINECMTRAIALYQADNSGRSYGCLFSDESDGALDADKKRQFASMKRRVLELGGYDREFFISHSTEVRDCADYVINVADLAA